MRILENKIEYKQGKKIKCPEIVEGVTLHEVTILFWPNHKKRGRKKQSV